MPHQQPTLFAPLMVAAAVQMHDHGPEGWVVHVATRLEAGSWGDRPSHMYSGLTASEALDVVCAVLTGELGLVFGD